MVIKRQPAISTDSQDSATLPNASISDTATVTNLTSDATGTVTFNLYAPGDTTCATSIWSNQKPLGTVTSNSATVTSDSHVVTTAGTYRWIAAYSGDAKNEAVSGQCNDPNESTVVNKAPATITTDAQDTAKLPDAIDHRHGDARRSDRQRRRRDHLQAVRPGHHAGDADLHRG